MLTAWLKSNGFRYGEIMKNKTIQLVLLINLILFLIPLSGQEIESKNKIDSIRSWNIQVPESYLERIEKTGTVLELSLRESVRKALSNNLEIAIENFNGNLSYQQIVKTSGFYDPGLSFTMGYNARENPTTSILDGARGGELSVLSSNGFSFDTNLNQNVKGGGALRLLWSNGRNFTNSFFFNVNPSFNTNFDVSFTQPLWRGFGRNSATERQLIISNLDIKINDAQFKQRVVEIIQRVQNQYWELVYAIENFETQRKSLGLAVVQDRNNQKRVEIGVMAPIEVTSSQAEIASREQSLIQSEVQIINAQNELKRLLSPDPMASIWDLTLIPIDRPQIRDVTISLKEAIGMSVENRPELERIRLQIEQNGVNRRFYKKEGKPKVDLRANFGSLGNSGRVLKTLYMEDGIFGIPTQTPDLEDPRYGNFGTAWNQAFAFDFVNWGLYVDVTIPLRNRSNKSDVTTTKIRENQLKNEMRNQKQIIVVEVRNAYETIATRKKSLEAARAASLLAHEQLNGENKRFEAGLSTNFEILRLQRDLAESQVRELRNEVDYELALASLQKAIYTIVNENDIVLARQN